MPPVLPRKRLRTPSPLPSPAPNRNVPQRATRSDPFSVLDSTQRNAPSVAENRAFLDALEDDQSSLSSADSDSDDFEDVLPTPAAKKQKLVHKPTTKQHEDSDEDLEFEDVADALEGEQLTIPEISENFEVTVRAPGEGEPLRLTTKLGGKASITKKMRQARLHAHCMHVQFLMWHNVVRNSWINNTDVHAILLKGLPEALKAEVSRWKLAMGYEKPPEKKSKKRGGKTKVSQKSSRERIRDWGADTEKSEQNTQADPIVRLLKYLAAYWKKRFIVTAPSLRKLGYRNPRDMRQEMDSFHDGPHDPARHGERIADLEEFRELAKKCKGSRDVGAQLFTALLRGLGIEARLVASLQPTGFGWSKVEDAHPRRDAAKATTDAAESDRSKDSPHKASEKIAPKHNSIGSNNRPINLDSDASSLSSSLSDEDGVKLSEKPNTRPIQARYDRDLLYPTYWTEVLSPVSNNYIPISTMLHPNVITSAEHIGSFEPRGGAAEKGKQVMAYVLAYSADGTAKDVTVRYLRKRQWPGKTKGFRIPVEKVPIYNSNGKVIRYIEYDWFKRVMRGFSRPDDKRTLADDIEDAGDLVSVQPATNEKKRAEPDTLQGYKQSPDFVLERHLRREEALRTGTKPVKHFHIGKGDKAVAEPVYKRSDVVTAKSVETWHKEGRQVKFGEQALKQVPYRAVTLLRKREIEDQTRDMDGQKPMQGLYAEYQTEWIIPEPIGPDRAIPRNAFNNIDVYVQSMVPKGAVHIPLKGTARVCKRLGIDFAEACTGFEFGKQRAVPVLTGVVVAEENEDLVIDAWREDERARLEKEDKKREEKSLKLWKKFLRGLKVRERIGREYGFEDGDTEAGEAIEEWAGSRKGAFGLGGGGFLREGEGGAEDSASRFVHANFDDQNVTGSPHLGTNGSESQVERGGFFLPGDSEDESQNGGGFEIIGGSQDPSKKGKERAAHLENEAGARGRHLPAPISLQAMHADAGMLPSVQDDFSNHDSPEGDHQSTLPEPDNTGELASSGRESDMECDDYRPGLGTRAKLKKSAGSTREHNAKKSKYTSTSLEITATAASTRKKRKGARKPTYISSPFFQAPRTP